MDNWSLKLSGDRDLIRDLRKLRTSDMRRTVRKAAREGAELLERAAEREAPSFTGKLRFNIFSRARFRAQRAEMKGEVLISQEGKADNTRNAFYWRFIEYGTRFIQANPFLTRAFEAMKERVAQLFFRRIDAELDKFEAKGKL